MTNIVFEWLRGSRNRNAPIFAAILLTALTFMAGSAGATPCHGCDDGGGGGSGGNSLPTVNVNNGSVTVNEGQTAANTGAYSDPDGNATVTLSASVGSMTKDATGDGTWSWSFGTNDGPDQSQTVTITATDNVGEVATTTFSLNVNNVAPTAIFNRTSPVNEGSAINLSLTNPNDPSSVDRNAGFTYAFNCGSGFSGFASTDFHACPTNDNGNRAVEARIRDKDNGVTQYSGSVTVNNVPPTATFNAPVSADEGSAFGISLTNPFDPSSVDTASGFSYAFDCGEGFGAFGASNTASCQTGNAASRTVRGKIRDKDGGETVYTRAVAINDVTPPNTTITSGPSGLVRSAGATFEWSGTDNRTPDTGLLYSHKQDNGEWSAYSGDTGVTLNGLSQGIHTFSVRAKDAAGNVDESPATRAFTVDTVAPAGGVKINNNAAKTKNLKVRLALNASDSVSGVSRMCVSNKPGCSAWQPFARSKAWRLSGKKAGVKRVYVRFQDRAGNVSTVYKDTIKYAPKKRR